MKFLGLALALTTAILSAQAPSAQAPSAHLGPNGRLVYAHTRNGDRIPDFSYAGYLGGGVALPTAPSAETLAPTAQDDTAALQSAIDRTTTHATAEHHPLALTLAPGIFHLAHTINITSSNVVVRGSGVGKTILMLTGTPHLGIHIGASTKAVVDEDQAAPSAPPAGTTLTDAFVPAGTLTLTVANAAGLAAGDTILITRAITPAYLAFMGMDRLVRDGKPEHWTGPRIAIERRIASIAGNTLTLDVPLTDSYDPQYGGGHDTKVAKIAAPVRLLQVGVEALSMTAPSVSINLSDPHFDGIQIASTQDAWLRDLRFEDTINTITVDSTSRRVTIDHVDILQRLPIQSSAKNFAISLAGTQILVVRSSARGDKVFYVATQARQQGPNVVLHCDFTGDQAIEPHQRWSTGFLVDSTTVHGGAINFYNRGTMGSGHGWTVGWSVIWNSASNSITVQNPPGSINWAIGSSGARLRKPMPTTGGPKGPDLPEGQVESPDRRVQPDSLYLQQLSERLGRQAVHNIGY